MPPDVFHVAFLGHSHPVFDLGEGLFDGIEVGAIGWQEPEPGAGCPDGVADGLRFMTSEIVHDDDVAGLEGSDELLLHIGPEARPVDGAVEHAGRGEPVVAQRGDEGHGAPVAMRREADETLAFRTPAPGRRHVGLDPGLVDEHQALGVEPDLPCSPTLPTARHRRPGTFKGEQGFF